MEDSGADRLTPVPTTAAIIPYNSEIKGAEWIVRFRIALKLGIVRQVYGK